MKFKAWHLFLAGVITQVIALVLLITNFQGTEDEWGLAFGIFFLIGTIIASSVLLVILIILKTKILFSIVSIVLGLGIGCMIIAMTRGLEVTSTIGLISGIAVGVLFISAGIMAVRKRI